VVIDGAQGLSSQLLNHSNIYSSDGKQARVAAKEAKLIIQQTASGIDEIKCLWFPNLATVSQLKLELTRTTGNQLTQLLRSWLSPVDPSTNHNIARKAQQEGTAVWLFEGKTVIEWKTSGSLLWIHGKRAFLLLFLASDFWQAPGTAAGSGKSVIWFVVPRLLPVATYLFCASSSVIQDIMALCETGLAIMAYFYFDFRDLNKQTCHDLLRSLVFQLSTDSNLCCYILHRVYKAHKDGTQQPSDDTLKECLKEMLIHLAHGRIFLVLDALDECPDSSGLPPPRSEVLQLVKELVDLRLRGLHICATSRPEVDIHAVLEPLAFRSVSLHDESGQKTDIAEYVRSVVNSSPSTAMRRWRADDKNLVIETLTERADGMWVRHAIRRW
jgi:hypothetical protein